MTAFVVGILATWRLTSLLVAESGPWDIFGKLRDFAGVYHDDYSQAHGTNEVARALACIWCASVWVGGGVATLQGYRLPNVMLRALVYSAGTILIDRWLHAR